MQFDNIVYIADLIECFSLILIIIGGFFALYQWNKSVHLKRAEYINELTNKIRGDKDIQETIYLFDYSELWYSDKFHGGGTIEEKVDKTLSYFSYICYLRNQKIISKKEFKFFDYEIKRILLNWQVQDYFYNLYHFSGNYNVPFSFIFLFDYGKKIKCFDNDFYDSNSYITSKKYHKYLNF